jgi:hypothetical protein
MTGVVGTLTTQELPDGVDQCRRLPQAEPQSKVHASPPCRFLPGLLLTLYSPLPTNFIFLGYMCNPGSSLDKVMIYILIYLCPVAENLERLAHY